MWTSPLHATTRGSFCGSDVVGVGLGGPGHVACCKHPWVVTPDLYFCRYPDEIEKERQVAVEKAVTEEEFQGGWTAPALEFTATWLENTNWSQSTGPSVAGP